MLYIPGLSSAKSGNILQPLCVCSVGLEGSSAPVLAAMCGPDCDDVMDDVSNSH